MWRACQYGRNCLVSSIEENIQVTEDYATSFEKSNVNDLKIKLEQCLNKENRKEDNEISQFILNKYNWDDIVEKTEKLYKRG